jgi:hypothetical protein
LDGIRDGKNDLTYQDKTPYDEKVAIVVEYNEKYRDLVDKRFDIIKVIRIERSFDKDDIANKWCDFSLGTITNLFNQGIEDALETLAKEVKKSKNVQAAYNEVDLFIRNVKKQMANNTLVQYAENVKATLPNLKA